MTTKFTPGPWCVYCGSSETIEILNHSEELRIFSWTGFDSNDIAKEEDRANAHLISCAPEMYDLLESVKRELFALIDEVNDQRASNITSATETEPDYHDQETVHLIDKLLAKARGE